MNGHLLRVLTRSTWLALALAVTACQSTMASRERHGATLLTWQTPRLPSGASDVRYEVAIHAAEQGLPVRQVQLLTRLAVNELDASSLPPGDYLWTVRARYRRAGADWVTRWQTMPNTSASAIEPQRGFCPLEIPK
jgi:hypothetical protein